MTEPKLVSVSYRKPIGEDVELECAFDNGARGVIVTIDGQFPQLAESILLHLHCLAEDVT